MLKNIAQSANGIYVSANDLTSLDMLYASFINKLNMNKYKTMRQRKFHEQYQIFLIIGIFLLCAETLLGIKKGGSS